jgi:integrase
MSGTRRKILAAFGVRGNRRAIVVRDPARQRVLVERYVGGRPIRKTFELSREGERLAKLYAERWYVSPTRRTSAPLTLRAMWDAFWEARCMTRPEDGGLRPRTTQLYRERWVRFELYAKPDTFAEDVTLHTLDGFWNTLLKAGTAPNQIRNIITAVKVVYRWAESRELITRNRPHLYRTPGGAQHRAKEIPEYTPAEYAAIQATCRPQDAKRWRFAALWAFMGGHGFRSAATLALEWKDVDLKRGTVTMIEERDKTHQRITRPLTWDAYSALLTAQHWRVRLGYTGPWVFFAGQARRDGPWSYQAANQALMRAERAARVPHVRWRAFHGVRRMVAANVSSRTGDPALAMQWIGDDVRQATRYIQERAADFQAVADDRGTQ